MMQQYIWDVLDANSWLMVEGHSGLLFDPVNSPELFSALDGLDDLLVILTHEHFDHISGLNALRASRPDAKVLASAACSERIQRLGGNLSNIANAVIAFHRKLSAVQNLVTPFSCLAADQVFTGMLELDWHGHALRLSEFAGHSPGSICCEMDGALLISGDTLLHLPTVTRLPGGNTSRFFGDDFPRLEAMVGKIVTVYPGHGAPGAFETMLSINIRPAARR